MRAVRYATLSAALISISGAATAQADLSGNWAIHVTMKACTLGGQAKLTKADKGYTAQITMRQECPNYVNGPIVAVQTASVSTMGNQVTVRSKVVDFPLTEWSNSYAPDHFALTVKSNDRMFGIQTDRYGTLPAEWTRSEGGIS